MSAYLAANHASGCSITSSRRVMGRSERVLAVPMKMGRSRQSCAHQASNRAAMRGKSGHNANGCVAISLSWRAHTSSSGKGSVFIRAMNQKQKLLFCGDKLLDTLSLPRAVRNDDAMAEMEFGFGRQGQLLVEREGEAGAPVGVITHKPLRGIARAGRLIDEQQRRLRAAAVVLARVG